MAASKTPEREETALSNRPQPISGKMGATIIGPSNPAREAQNPDTLVPPRVDHGTLANLRWSFADSHMHLSEGGWGRQTKARELPIATEIAGVNMRLTLGGVRELHWHKAAEWPYMLKGRARITAIEPGWARVSGRRQRGRPVVLPRGEVLAKNVGVPESAFDRIPQKDLWIFQAAVPGPLAADRVAGAGPVPNTFSHRMLAQEPIRMNGGAVRITDSSVFKTSKTIAAALVEVEPGGLRELHWHPNVDEWQYYISGQARMTVFASQNNARTFNFQGGDVGAVPFPMGHYVENIGTTTLRFLEIFRSEYFADVSLAQWLAFTPHELVRAHLNIDESVLAKIPQAKTPVVRR
jgi:oxalate decarboxylase